jgi:metallopeptidase MepB
LPIICTTRLCPGTWRFELITQLLCFLGINMAVTQLRLPPSPPPVFTHDKDLITSRVEELINSARRAQEDVLSTIKPEHATFENVLLPLAQIHNSLTREIPILCFYQEISTDSDIRDASTKAKDQYADFEIETKMHEGLFGLIDAVVKKQEDVAPEDRRLLERYHRDYVRHGLGLASQQRSELESVQKRLVRQIGEFGKNLREESDGIWFTEGDLAGLPKGLVRSLKRGTDAYEGKLQLTFNFTHLGPTMKYAENSETRRRYYSAYENRCPTNVPIYQKIMVLRQEAAHLLGYPNHAAFRIEEKMAKTPEAVMAFLDDLHSRLATGARDDIKELHQFKNADLEARGQPSDDKFYQWDYAFYNRQMLEKHYSVDRQEIAEYFPLETTVKGVMDIFQHLFGLIFEEIVAEDRHRVSPTGKGEDLVWQEDLQVFAAWNDEQEGGDFLGYLYLDLHPRAGKNGGMCNINLQGVRASRGRPDETTC